MKAASNGADTKTSSRLSGLKIAIVIPPPIEGSGGIGEIFNRARAMADAGAKVDFYFKDFTGMSAAEAAARSIAYYGDHDFGVYPNPVFQDVYDVAIASAWDSVETVARQSIPTKLYLVQDYEAMFNPMGDGFILGELSYAKGLIPITLGDWLAWRLNEEFGIRSFVMPWAADLSIYHPEPEVEREDAICYVYQPEKPRRCQYIGLEALRRVKQARPKTKIYIFGTRAAPSQTFDFTFLSLLSKSDLRALYNRCKLGFVISATNPSRVPYEMMACGLPVLDIYKQNNLFDYPDSVVNLAYPTAESLAYSMLELLEDASRLEQLREAGFDYMTTRPIRIEHKAVVEAVRAAVDRKHSPVNPASLKPIFESPPMIAPQDRSPAALQFMRYQRASCDGSRTVVYLQGADPGEEKPGAEQELSLVGGELVEPDPSIVDFPLVQYRPNGHVTVHPINGLTPTIMRIGGGAPRRAVEFEARVCVDNDKAAPVNFAMLVAETTSSSAMALAPAEVSAKMLEGAHWTTVQPGKTGTVRLELPEPLKSRSDLYLATIMSERTASAAYAWALWQDASVKIVNAKAPVSPTLPSAAASAEPQAPSEPDAGRKTGSRRKANGQGRGSHSGGAPANPEDG